VRQIHDRALREDECQTFLEDLGSGEDLFNTVLRHVMSLYLVPSPKKVDIEGEANTICI
jgi:hypothetical protein